MSDTVGLLHNVSVPGFGSATYFDSTLCESGKNANIVLVFNLEHLTDVELINEGFKRLDFVAHAEERPFTGPHVAVRVIVKLTCEPNADQRAERIRQFACRLMAKFEEFGTCKAAMPKQRAVATPGHHGRSNRR